MIYSTLHSGDAGDCVSSLAICKKLGSVDYYVDDRPITKPILVPHRFNSIKPLIESQPYINKFEAYQGQQITHDFSTFREGGIRFGASLLSLHAEWVLGYDIPDDPWMEIEPNNDYKDCIVMCRSERHHNSFFPWRELIDHYKDDVVFLGTQTEHIQLQNETGRRFNWKPTADLLELGRIISASKLVIANQSCPINIAFAIGKRTVMCSSLTSIDCLYNRPDSFVVPDGEIIDLEVDGYEAFNSPSRLPERTLDLLISPPKSYWRLKSIDGKEHRDLNSRKVIKIANDYERVCGYNFSTERDLIDQTLERFPGLGSQSHSNMIIQQANEVKRLFNMVTKKSVLVNENV